MVASPLPALGDVSGHPFILHHILTGLLDHWRTVEAKLLWCFYVFAGPLWRHVAMPVRKDLRLLILSTG